MTEERVAAFIRERRRRRLVCRDIWSSVETLLAAERLMAEKDLIAFLYDTYYLALERETKSRKWSYYRAVLKHSSPSFKALKKLLPWYEEAKINPFCFFIWAIQQRRSKGIPPALSSICSYQTFRHFVSYFSKNTYRVISCAKIKEYEDQLLSRLEIDLVTFITFQLRKVRVMLSPQDLSLFSAPTKALLASQGLDIAFDDEDDLFLEELRFDPEFFQRIKQKWISKIKAQLAKVQDLSTPKLAIDQQEKIRQLCALLEVFIVGIHA